MRRHHYLYGRNRYLAVLEKLGELHRQVAAAQAVEIGLLDPDGPGSFTHPDSTRLIYGDGKVITPLFKAKPGETRVDKTTGEIKTRRHEPDAALHFEGTGETAWGTKFVMVAARAPTEHSRMILDFAFVTEPGAEARSALDCIRRLAPKVQGAQGVVYDTALRGVHHQALLRELGLLPINRVTEANAGAKEPRRAVGRRVEKSVHMRTRRSSCPSEAPRRFGSTHTAVRSASVGSPTPATWSSWNYVACEHNGSRTRWEPTAGTTTTRSLPRSAAERSWFACTERRGRSTAAQPHREREAHRSDRSRLRPAFPTAQRRRVNQPGPRLEDTMYLRRAHSVGHRRQLVNLLGYALVVNSLSLLRHRRREPGGVPIAA